MKVYKNADTPSWEEEVVAGRTLEHPLTHLEYEEAYKKWVPKDDIPFDKLVAIILPRCGRGSVWANKSTIVSEFNHIFKQIENGFDRKDALTLFLREVCLYILNDKDIKIQKNGGFNSYDKNSSQKIKGNKNAALQVYESLISSGIREGTETARFAHLLIDYSNQCDEILKSGKLLIKPLEIKDYRLPRRSKDSMRQCLKNIIKKYNIQIDSYLLNVAIESIKK